MTSELLDRFDGVIEFRNSLNPESDRGCALMAAAFLDAELDTLLRKYVVPNSRVADDLFGQSRPISTFSSRIDLAYLLGLIDPATHRDLHLIRKIRNDFGHVHAPLSFEDKAIAARCRELKIHFRAQDASPRKVFISCAVGALAIIHSAMHNRSPITERSTPDLESARATADRLTEALRVALDDEFHPPHPDGNT
jgi:DNA-binding MltR family transcriptional regulator